MGKTKQRTKGNARPSNSLRSAQLLSSTLGHAPINTFIGFDALKDTQSNDDGSGSILTRDEAETEADQDFRLVIKQMSKKDSVTKVKALQKFVEYCNEKDFDQVKSILSSWPRVFNRLAIDNDFRVREATFEAQEALVNKLGKKTATILKQIIAIWVISLHDTYPVAASAAKSSFSASFSPTKQSEVLHFCREEIINYCRDIVLVQTTQTIEDPSNSSAEDRESKYNRLVSCSLQAIALLIASLGQPEAIEDHISKFLAHDRFWKLEKFNDINVKVNWYRLKSTICEKYPNLVSKNEAKFTATTLHHIAEKDVLLSAAIWENVLWILVTIDNWWQHINIPKGFLPHLRKLLREGGYGNASSIFPNLLPMLSKFPFKSIENPSKFCEDFLESFEACMLCINHPTKEYACIVKSYFECVQYLLVEKVSALTLDSPDQIAASISDRLSQCSDEMLEKWEDIYGIYFSELTAFIASLKDQEVANQLISSLEGKLFKILHESCKDAQKLGLLTKLLSALLRINRDKSPRRVKFDEIDEEQQVSDLPEKAKSKAVILMDSLCKVWDLMLKLIAERETQTPWLHSLKMVQELCILLAKDAGSEFSANSFFDELKHLLQSQSNFTSSSTRSSNYNLIVGMMMNCCDSLPRTTEILHYISSLEDNMILINLFEVIKSRLDKDTFLQEWFTTPEVNSLISTATTKLMGQHNTDKSLTPDNTEALSDFLKFALQVKNVHLPTINDVAAILEQSLFQPLEDEQLIHVCFISKALFEFYPYSSQLDSSVPLIQKIFEISLDYKHSEEICDLLRSTFTEGLTVMSQSDDSQARFKLLTGIASIIQGWLKEEQSSWERSERIAQVSRHFIETLQKRKSQSGQTHLSPELLESLFPSSAEWLSRISSTGSEAFFQLWINEDIIIPQNLNISSDHVNLNESLIYSLYSVILILECIKSFPELSARDCINKHIRFICFAYESLELSPKTTDLSNKEKILEVMSDFLTTTLESLDEKEALTLIKSFISESSGENFPLLIGLRPFTRFCKRISALDSEWKLENYDYSSITIFHLIADLFSPDEIIELSQVTLRYFLCLENADSIRQSYGRLSVMNRILRSEVQLPSLDLIDPLMQNFLSLKEQHEELLLLECSLDNRKEEEILFAIEVMNIFRTIISKFHKHLNPAQKDLIIISVTAWSISFCNSSPKSFQSPYKMIFFCHLFQLFLEIQQKVEQEGDSFTSIREWTDFHLVRITSSFVSLLFHLNGQEFKGHQLSFVALLGKCIPPLPLVDIAGLESELEIFTFKEKEVHLKRAVIYSLPKECESIVTKLNHLLISKYPAFYLSAHSLIQKLVPLMVTSTTIVEGNENLLAPPKPFLLTLQETDLILHTLLSEYSLGSTCCLINPGTDSFSYTVAYLLNWLQILNLFSQLNDENRSLLAGYLTESGYFGRLLDNLFKLMPLQPDDQVSEEADFIQNLLTDNILYQLDETLHVQSLSCLVYFHILRKMPACVRMWWTKLDKRTSELVNRFTTENMSELICAEEFNAVQNADSSKLESIRVKARHAAREVVAIYAIEDMSIDLTIKLAENHPLTPVSIDGGKRVAVGVPEWRNWLLQVTSILTHQNGTVLDGLILWNRNMSKRFEGLEECVICYFILQGSNCQVPKLSCRNCKKKFHSACLYKWFEKSNQSTCPWCRNLFTFNKQQQQQPVTTNPNQP